ncbi:MAG: HD domain-containing protein [Gammaproteobacteria bacterium]|nr:MAG: HD domain-containing protein [Gammaproteobacteria bacterium]
MRKKYSLQVTISTLFIAIITILGFTLIWQSFDKTSDIMLDSAYDLYEHIPEELNLDIKATYGPIVGALQHLRSSPVTRAQTFEQRKKQLPVLKAMLASAPSAAAVGIAYEDGDYFGAMFVRSEIMRQKYHVPAGAVFMVRYLNRLQPEAGFETDRMYTIFYDDNLVEISRSTGRESQFDPRLRPWYQQLENRAVGTVIRTKPYVFYDSRIVGLTVSEQAADNVVVAFDITLQDLAETISKYRMTESSEVVLINAQGEVVAYEDQQRIIVGQVKPSDDETLRLARLDQLGSGVLSYINKNILNKADEIKEQSLDFGYNGKRWIGSVRGISNNKDDLYALMLTPVGELLKDAVGIRENLINIALVVLIVFIPVVWFAARKISTPLNLLSKETEAISRFDFEASHLKPSFIKEVDELDSATELMKSTISKFIKLINSLAGEQNLDALIKSITRETMQISHSDAALIYLIDEQDDLLKADYCFARNGGEIKIQNLLHLTLDDVEKLFQQDKNARSCVIGLNRTSENQLTPLLDSLGEETLSCIVLPLQNRIDETIGLLCLLYRQGDNVKQLSNIEFVEALSGFAAVTLESRQSLKMQEELLHSFIKLIAGAIDAKSPYTGGHCTRVPEVTLMLAKAACESDTGKYRDFELSDKQWEELSIAGWLHDCGKVTTPEYVVDKATKLETIYDRIHEVRMRFEVLKRDAEIECWQQIAKGGNKQQLLKDLAKQNKELDDDFAFIAECNVGGEFMADEKIERLQTLAEKTWKRTLDDNLGLSWEELNRKQNKNDSLPVEENLLADKAEHLIARHEIDKMPEDNQWGFKVDTPEYKYNRGELYNLSVKKGTLSEEERYMINSHMIQTIIMLNNLPYPKSLRNVPLIAGSHHETMDGKGYPKRLVMTEQLETARMMVIADIFEALTASDRPYKKAKTLSESLRILSFMRNDKHIDPDLFDLFLSSGVYLEYAKKFLSPSQIDEVNIEDYLF